MTTIGLVVPTYNEAKNAPLLLRAVRAEIDGLDKVVFLVVIVDDGSPDGTSQIAKDEAKKLETDTFKVHIIDRKIKDGYGNACITGMKYLLDKNVDFVMQMDADLSHDPIYINDFVAASKNHDFVIASRYVKGSSLPDWPLFRKLLSHYGNFYIKVFLGQQITDYTGGFNLYSAQLLRNINLASIRATGYGFLIELKYRALIQAKSVYQFPIIFRDRQHGKSKLPKSTLYKNLLLAPLLRAHIAKENRSR